MNDEEATLFDLDDAKPEVGGQETVSAEQVARLQAAFSKAGLVSEDSQRLIVSTSVLRPVQSLFELFPSDMRPIMNRIAEHAARRPQSGSAWDNREQDTWIDKL